jgi:NAD(P)-dependent dehydrogenase (short-subunit alcohol dehydrogenase family)
MSTRFADRTVIITGAVGALGEVLVQDFANEGANVVIAARREAEGTKLAEAIGDKAMFVKLDVTSEASWLEKELLPTDKFAIPRQASTAEISKYILFVASDDAAFSTASEFIADGGFSLGPIS